MFVPQINLRLRVRGSAHGRESLAMPMSRRALKKRLRPGFTRCSGNLEKRLRPGYKFTRCSENLKKKERLQFALEIVSILATSLASEASSLSIGTAAPILHFEPDLNVAVEHVRDIAKGAHVIAGQIIEVMRLYERQQWDDLRTVGNLLKRRLHRHVVHEVWVGSHSET